MGVSFKDLLAWQRAIELSLQVYKLTSDFPSTEQFGLTSQMRRASVSIASNIAEGSSKASKGEFLQFLGHAKVSNCELQTQLIIAEGLQLGSTKALYQANRLSADVSRLLLGLTRSLKR